jgi:hypothetical protein
MASATLPVNTASTAVVTGQYLAHSKRTKTESAFLAAGLHLGDIRLDLPTIGQSSVLADVSPSYVRMVISCPEGRRKLVKTGVLPLRFAVVKAQPMPVSPAALAAELVNAVGLDTAFDLLVEATER